MRISKWGHFWKSDKASLRYDHLFVGIFTKKSDKIVDYFLIYACISYIYLFFQYITPWFWSKQNGGLKWVQVMGSQNKGITFFQFFKTLEVTKTMLGLYYRFLNGEVDNSCKFKGLGWESPVWGKNPPFWGNYPETGYFDINQAWDMGSGSLRPFWISVD